MKNLFNNQITVQNNLIILSTDSIHINQQQTNNAFTEKWTKEQDIAEYIKSFENFQKKWYLTLYGFKSEHELSEYLKTKSIIFDAGCGLGYKAAWFAELAPDALVIAMDYSESVLLASNLYAHLKNLYFIQGDIANTNLKSGIVDYISCDQVIMHTENPEYTFAHLTNLLKEQGEFSCYVYRKKALPRELLDEYFREYSKELSHEQIWNLSEQLTHLGKLLTEQNIILDFPDIPLLGIKGGRQDLQRFIYWNFIKCYWNQEQGWNTSVSGNFDWYSPSNAKRYSEEEFRKMINDNLLTILYFHREEACYSGRFLKA